VAKVTKIIKGFKKSGCISAFSEQPMTDFYKNRNSTI